MTLKNLQTPLLDLFTGVDFIPLQSSIYLTVETLMAELTEAFPQIAKLLFLYQVCGGFERGLVQSRGH